MNKGVSKVNNDIFNGLQSLNIEDVTMHIVTKLHEANYVIPDIAAVVGLSDRTINRYMKVIKNKKIKS